MTTSSNTKNGMYDLIYLGFEDECSSEERKEVEQLIRKSFPKAKLSWDQDYIHGYRLVVKYAADDYQNEDYFYFLIKNGLAKISLILGLEIGMNPDNLKPIIDRLKKEQKSKKE